MLGQDCLIECGPCEDCCECEPAPRLTNDVVRWRAAAWMLTAGTITWNAVEALVAVISGWAARSIALVGFGLDSAVEVTSALVVVWGLSAHRDDGSAARTEERAVRLIALSFFGLALYVAVTALHDLSMGEAPERSVAGLVLLSLSLVVMPALFIAKQRIARRVGSAMLGADANQTKVCIYLSVAVLVGLAGNALAGWWWLDPMAGLVVAGVAAREGYRAWSQGELCVEDQALMRLACSPDCCAACPALA